MFFKMSPKPAKQKPKKMETTEITSDSETMEEVSRVRPTYGSKDSSPICGDQASRLHADTSGIIQAINSMKADMASQFETVLSAVQDIKIKSQNVSEE